MHQPTKAPIHVAWRPINLPNAPTTPWRVCRPMPISTISSGIAHKNRKISHGIKKAPPPLLATIRGNRHMLPVPTAIPRAAISNAHLEVKLSVFVMKPDFMRPYVTASIFSQ